MCDAMFHDAAFTLVLRGERYIPTFLAAFVECALCNNEIWVGKLVDFAERTVSGTIRRLGVGKNSYVKTFKHCGVDYAIQKPQMQAQPNVSAGP